MRRPVGVGLLVVAAVTGAWGIWWVVDRDRGGGIRRDPIDRESVVVLGDSITAGGDWRVLLPGTPIVNEGYPGATTAELVDVADAVASRSPAAVFVLTGTNDIRDGLPPARTVRALSEILDVFAKRSPRTRVVVQTILPRAARAAEIVETNLAVVDLAGERGVELLDLHQLFDDGDGGLRPADSTDGWHLSDAGYERWATALAGALDGQTR